MSNYSVSAEIEKDESKIWEMASQLLTELELLLNLGQKLSRKDLNKLSFRMRKILENQVAVPKKKIQVRYKKRVLY
jgi:hypothetical protein